MGNGRDRSFLSGATKSRVQQALRRIANAIAIHYVDSPPPLGADNVQDAIDALKAGFGSHKVKVDGADTTADYLAVKLVAGANVSLTVQNVGGNETLRVDASGGGGSVSGAYIDGGVSLLDVAAVGAPGTAIPASASGASGRAAVGFVTSVAAGVATVQYAGEVGGFAGLTPNADYWIGPTPGTIVTPAPLGPSRIIRKVGTAKNATTMVVNVCAEYVETAP